MTFARVPFHGFTVPLIGVSEDETLQECEDCHDLFCLLQVRLNPDGHFRCDQCTEHDQKAARSVALPSP